MIIFLIVTAILLAGSTGYLGYRHVSDVWLHKRAERAWREYQTRRAERKLHDVASDTFRSMMATARKASDGCEWHR